MMTLEQARGLVKVSQRQLARSAGVGKDTVCGIETGTVDPANVPYATIVRLVRALQRLGLPGLTADDLFPVHDQVAA
jgi:predicted transcriptional regulator